MKKWILLLIGLNLVVVLVALGCFFAGGFETPEQIHARYRARMPEVLKIAEPVEVTNGFLWLDGGTYGIELTDAKEEKHLFCLGHTNSDGQEGVALPPNLYVGASHFSKPGARMVAVRGPEEADLYGVLLRYIDRHPFRQIFWEKSRLLTQKEQAIPHLGVARSFFQRFEKHFVR